MTIYCVGNDAVSQDAIAVCLIPYLSKAFPDLTIIQIDPTENFTPEPNSMLIDAVEGIQEVTLFDDIDAFVSTTRVSVHEYDIGLHLQLLKKLHKLPPLLIIGLPQQAKPEDVLDDVVALVTTTFNKTQRSA